MGVVAFATELPHHAVKAEIRVLKILGVLGVFMAPFELC